MLWMMLVLHRTWLVLLDQIAERLLPYGLRDRHRLLRRAGTVIVVCNIQPAFPVPDILLSPLPVGQHRTAPSLYGTKLR